MGTKNKPKKLITKTALLIYIGIFSVVGTALLLNSRATISPTNIGFETANDPKCTGGINITAGNTSFIQDNSKAYEGTYSAKASFTGGTENAYARCVVTTSWVTGDEVWYGGAFFLPSGFSQSMQNQVDLMRWDNFSLNNASQDWGGIIIQNSDKQARLKRFNVSSDYTDISTPFTFPENRWVWLEVHQKFSPTDGQAINEVYLDGTLQSSSIKANTYGRDVTRIRYGLVAIGAGSQTNPLNLWVDRATISTSKTGPISTTTPTCTKQADINCDNAVNVTDLSILLSNYGKTTAQLASSTPSYPRADINTSGKVDIADLSALLTGYGQSGGPTATCTSSQHTPGGSDSLGGCWPGSTNTGIPPGTVLTAYTGPKIITTANTVIDSKIVSSGLDIRAAGVVIKNSKVSGVGAGEDIIAIDTSRTGASVTIQDTEIDAGNGPFTGIGDINWTATRVNIHNGHRGVHCYDNCTLQDSYLYDQWTAVDGSAHESGARMGQNSTFTHNTLWCNAPNVPPDGGCSADLTGYGDWTIVHDNKITKNFFMGTSGGFCAYGGSSAGKPFPNAHHIEFRDNVFGKNKTNDKGKPDCAYYGSITDFNPSAPGNVWENNKYTDGVTINL